MLSPRLKKRKLKHKLDPRKNRLHYRRSSNPISPPTKLRPIRAKPSGKISLDVEPPSKPLEISISPKGDTILKARRSQMSQPLQTSLAEFPSTNRFVHQSVNFGFDDEDPMTLKEALRMFKKNLNSYEVSEIRFYSYIYYLGLKAQKIIPDPDKENNGFDDENFYYKLIPSDQIAYRYQIKQNLGSGSFGQVVQAMDHKEKWMVAIKILKNKPRFHSQGKVEIKILETLNANDPEQYFNIVRMKETFTFRNHIWIVFDLHSLNLYDYLKIKEFAGVSISRLRRFTVQIVQALRLCHQLHIVHCDIKPENILLKYPHKSALRLIDFGSAWFENEKIYTYIQSRYYRSPEIMLGIPYTTAIDVWSLGWVIFELATGKPLFQGRSELSLFNKFVELLGYPPAEMLKGAKRFKMFFDSQSVLRPPNNDEATLPFSRQLDMDDPVLEKFILTWLNWDPNKRVTPDELLKHKWILSGLPKHRSNSVADITLT